MVAGVCRGDCILRPIKWYRELLTASGRRESGLFLLDGVRAVQQVIFSHPEAVDELLISDRFDDDHSFSEFTQRILTESQLRSIVPSLHPQGIAAVLRIPHDSYSSKLPEKPGMHIVFLEDVQDPGNVGTIIRTAAAFNFSGILLTSRTADPFSPKVVQSSAGALFAPWIRRSDAVFEQLLQLKNDGYRLLCADVGGAGHLSFAADEKLIIALGNEGAGLSRKMLDLADIRYVIPMCTDAVESLNVAVAGAISLFAVFRRCGW